MPYAMVIDQASQEPCVAIYRAGYTNTWREWRGEVARFILEQGILPRHHCRSGCYACDKQLVWHIILAAAAASVAIKHDNSSAVQV